MILDIINEVLSILSTTAVTVVLSVIAALIIYGFKLLCSKLGITINTSTMDEIVGIISQVIKYLDQKFVDTIKKNSPDGKLTEHQKYLIKTKSLEMVKSILSSEQVDFLLKKYNMENIDDVLDILIESNIKDSRSNSATNDTIIINDNIDQDNDEDSSLNIATHYIPTEEEIASLSVCPGNCNICTLSCNIRRS